MHEFKKTGSLTAFFYFWVKTTGIFCRPSCPSPTAKEKNAVYFETVFDSLENGFWPCLRCQPDVEVEYVSGSPDGEYAVNAAHQMIYDGYLNDNSISDLSKELLITETIKIDNNEP